MTDTTASTPAPKKSYTKYVVIIVIILAGWFDYSKTHFLLGKESAAVDSTIVVAPTIDKITNVVVPIDTTKKDTTTKK